jgi:hypothetical protein
MMEDEPGPNLLDLFNPIPLIQHHAERFSRAHPEHAGDVDTFLQELFCIKSELQSAVYARQKNERGW